MGLDDAIARASTEADRQAAELNANVVAVQRLVDEFVDRAEAANLPKRTIGEESGWVIRAGSTEAGHWVTARGVQLRRADYHVEDYTARYLWSVTSYHAYLPKAFQVEEAMAAVLVTHARESSS